MALKSHETIIDDIQDMLGSNTTDFTDALLTKSIERSLHELSQYCPHVVRETFALTEDSKEIDISEIKDLLWIDAIEFKTGKTIRQWRNWAAHYGDEISMAIDFWPVDKDSGIDTDEALDSGEEAIDPVGSLVGRRGVRVQAVMAEIGEEKIDIVLWDEDPKQFIINALAPAKIDEVKLDKKSMIAKVKTAADQLSLTIGKSGQNVRLASKLTKWQIEVDKEGSSVNSGEAEKTSTEEKIETESESKEEAKKPETKETKITKKEDKSKEPKTDTKTTKKEVSDEKVEKDQSKDSSKKEDNKNKE